MYNNDNMLTVSGVQFILFNHDYLRKLMFVFDLCKQLGVFEMSESGFKAVSNATEMFLTEQDPDSDVLVGLAFTVIMDGSRTFIIEVQVIFEF
jgi:DNA repair protein RadA/Sms